MKLKIKYVWLIPTAIIIGFIQGIIWGIVGEKLYHVLGTATTWFILPVLISIIISIPIYFIELKSEKTFKKSIVFLLLEHFGHWLPSMLIFLAFAIGGANM